MRELIGDCQSCGRPVYCENGFFDGEQIAGQLLCPDCALNEQDRSNNSQAD